MRELDEAIVYALDQAAGVPTVYRGHVDEGDALPAVVFTKSAGTSVYTKVRADKRDAYRVFVYIVKAVGEGDNQDGCAAIDRLIDNALTDNALEGVVLDNGEGVIVSCRRQTDIEYEERTDGVTYQHIGGSYRVYVTR